MKTAKIFTSGNSQAVRLPKECRFEEKEVYIKKIDGVVMLIPPHKVWEIFENSFCEFSSDLKFSRENYIDQETDEL